MPGNINFSMFWSIVGRSVPPLLQELILQCDAGSMVGPVGEHRGAVRGWESRLTEQAVMDELLNCCKWGGNCSKHCLVDSSSDRPITRICFAFQEFHTHCFWMPSREKGAVFWKKTDDPYLLNLTNQMYYEDQAFHTSCMLIVDPSVPWRS